MILENAATQAHDRPAHAPDDQQVLARRAAAAWDAYDSHRKSPRTCKAGSEFADARRHRGCATLLRGTVS
jgi:hypothetical protein